MKRIRSPREKKELSYGRDGRNVRAESRSKAHKAISRRKAKANRSFRREEKLACSAAKLPDVDDVFVARIGRRSWKKIPDVTLGEYVARRLDDREKRGINTRHKQSRTLAASVGRARHSPGLYLGGLFHGPLAAANRIRAAAENAER